MLVAYPPGSRVSVAYDPVDPSAAVLRRGQPGQLFERAAIVLGVFGLWGPYWWFALFGQPEPRPDTRRRFDPHDPGPRTPDSAGGSTVRLPVESLIHPLLVFLVAGLFVVLIARTRPSPPDPYPWWQGFLSYVVAPAVVLLLALLRRRPTLTADAGHRRLVRAAGWPRAQQEVPFAAVKEVRVGPHRIPVKGGQFVITHQVMLTCRAAGPAPEVVLGEYEYPADADALAAWVREQVGLTPVSARTGATP
jgi:hypothetical protein